MSAPTEDRFIDDAVTRAASWLERANALATAEENRRRRRMDRLVGDAGDKNVLTALIDRCFRSRTPRRVADQLGHVVATLGVPRFLSFPEKTLLGLFRQFGRHFPSLTVPGLVSRMRAESRSLIVPGEREPLTAYMAERRAEGVRVNLNRLGEEVLGEGEACARMARYRDDLRDPRVEAVALKISTLCAQIRPLAFTETVDLLSRRLGRLLSEAAANAYVRPDGTRAPKTIHLDMEAFRDLALTAAAFRQALDGEAFRHVTAGMALQAYLPDSFGMLKELTDWAKRRVAAGGSPVRVRIVKGANMEMERVESSLSGWPLACYDSKRDTDANWKRMVAFALEPENLRAVHLGVASHNLFDLAYAYGVARRNRVTEHFSFEMIEGMANPQRRALRETGVDRLTYAPAAEERHFISAIAYLVRRLDENTAPENFLRHVNRLKPGTPTWGMLAGRFRDSVRRIPTLADATHRTQDRSAERFPVRRGAFHEGIFTNEPNTDWSLAANRGWAEEIRRRWMKSPGDAPVRVPIVVAGKPIASGRRTVLSIDPNRLPEKVAVASCCLANAGDAQAAAACAREDPDGWRRMTPRRRRRILSAAAEEIRRARGDLIGAAAATTGKVFTEADPEVSEAVDFAEYYPHAAERYFRWPHVRCRGKGVGLVISPWNFPIAIPCGGIAAALTAGNTVIFKPSSSAILVGWLLCQCFWRAGVSPNTLQFLPAAGENAGRRLALHPEVDFIILTGGTATGMNILKGRPGATLTAETGGKNAVVVTAMSDREQAVADVVYSAFGHGGQKCSAASLLVLEREVYEDAAFKRQLVDAAATFKAGSAWDFTSATGPLVRAPRGPLKEALTGLDPGESWALAPAAHPQNPQIWSPGIKWGVSPGSAAHLTEFFGPVLGVMDAEDLERAVALANQTGYGLTAGLASLDEREHEFWKRRIRAGNLYINRGTTGAVTLRQPFGGMGKSALGAGIKTGGPHYVLQFMDIEELGPPPLHPIDAAHPLLRLAQRWELGLRWGRFGDLAAELRRTVIAIRSYLFHAGGEFSRETDFVKLRGQDNILRHLPVGTVAVRLHAQDSLFDALARIAAAKVAGNRLRVSLPRGLDTPAARFLHAAEGRRLCSGDPVVAETDSELIALLPEIDRLRYAAPQRVPSAVLAAAAETGFFVAAAPVRMEGRIELLHYYRQQSVCTNYHRYGNLGRRLAEFGAD